MGNLTWYINRLRAMNIPEVCWRIQQKIQYKDEATKAKKKRSGVADRLLYKNLKPLFEESLGTIVTEDSLPLKKEPLTSVFGPERKDSIHLLGNFRYADYKTDWHAGFNTPNKWPLQPSHSLQYKQCDSIGDARLNWELNRGYQLALAAANGNIDELELLLDSWNKENPWLYGISWTSVMEVAIRAIQWVCASYFLSFVKHRDVSQLKRKFETGALNMTEYVSRHYSRFSSANNHLLVEACCLVFAGVAFKHRKWHDLGIKLLEDQLENQNYPDGVNMEMALHYQTFAMEAYALAIIVSDRLNGKVPDNWNKTLTNMCRFVSWSTSAGIPMEWGDNDEGKILDLKGGEDHWNHYEYILNLYKFLGIPVNLPDNENVVHFPDGGYTFARSTDHRVLVGMDHAPLGFGSIAAHGHADALSLQLIVDGTPVLTDPGTYVYHCWIDKRNEFRRTINHNTVCVGNSDQSEMLGAFLWGKKAKTSVNEITTDRQKGTLKIKASHDGYSPVVHSRSVVFDGNRNITVSDELSEDTPFTLSYMLGSQIEPIMQEDNSIVLAINGKQIARMSFDGNSPIKIDEINLSPDYGMIKKSHAVRIHKTSNKIKTHITII